MEILIDLLATFGLCLCVKEMDGPFNLISKWRNLMMRLPLIGVQFYNLLNCYYCTGCWCGGIIYLIGHDSYKLGEGACYVFAGGAFCMLVNGISLKLFKE